MPPEKPYFELQHKGNYIAIHILNFYRPTNSFAKHAIAFLDRYREHTLVAALPQKLSQRLSKYLTNLGFDLYLTRYEDGAAIEHWQRKGTGVNNA